MRQVIWIFVQEHLFELEGKHLGSKFFGIRRHDGVLVDVPSNLQNHVQLFLHCVKERSSDIKTKAFEAE